MNPTLDNLFLALTDIIGKADDEDRAALYAAFKAYRERYPQTCRKLGPIPAALFGAIDAGTKFEAMAEELAMDEAANAE